MFLLCGHRAKGAVQHIAAAIEEAGPGTPAEYIPAKAAVREWHPGFEGRLQDRYRGSCTRDLCGPGQYLRLLKFLIKPFQRSRVVLMGEYIDDELIRDGQPRMK